MEKYAFITGGTKGIGKAVAECLAKAGYQLILTFASDVQRADEVRMELARQYGISAAGKRAVYAERLRRSDDGAEIGGVLNIIERDVFCAGARLEAFFDRRADGEHALGIFGVCNMGRKLVRNNDAALRFFDKRGAFLAVALKRGLRYQQQKQRAAAFKAIKTKPCTFQREPAGGGAEPAGGEKLFYILDYFV